MAEYIEREALLQDISETVLFSVRGGVRTPTPEMRGANKVIDRINSAKAADVAEVRHGEWIRKEDGHCVCSECGRTRPYSSSTYAVENWVCNYCHYCGADMRGGMNE